jgi:hypothetical protein
LWKTYHHDREISNIEERRATKLGSQEARKLESSKSEQSIESIESIESIGFVESVESIDSSKLKGERAKKTGQRSKGPSEIEVLRHFTPMEYKGNHSIGQAGQAKGKGQRSKETKAQSTIKDSRK